MPERCQRTDQIQALLYHARSATLFCSESGEACASVPAGVDSRRVLALRSAPFRDWLTANFYGEYETAPSASAFRAVLHTLEARAHFGDVPAQKVDRRVSFDGDPLTPARVFIDLANDEGEVLEISSQGWKIGSNLRRAFQQPATALALSRPEQPHGSGEALDKFLQIFRLSGTNRIRILAWLISAFRPAGPYPILVLQGPATSGKSALARALRALVDPSTAPIRRLPRRERELLELAANDWMLVFDEVQRVRSKISEALCAVSSGEVVEVKRTGRSPVVFHLSRPAILIAPKEEGRPAWIPTRSLSKRTLLVELAPLESLRSEAEIWECFEGIRPALLGRLADAIAAALRRAREVDLSDVVRLAGCATWAAAAGPALGLEEADIIDAFAAPSSMWLGFDPLRDVVYSLLATGGSWTGSAAELLDVLRKTVPPGALPLTPKGLTQALPRLPGLVLARKRDSRGERMITLMKNPSISEKTPAAAGTVIVPGF